MCTHRFFESDYNTIVCQCCGVERRAALKPTEGYTENVPLDPGYSRHHRMSTLLKQLFRPRFFGSPNSEVTAHALKHGPFKNGEELLLWLAKLKVKHKQYQNAHYYFASADPKHEIRTPPCASTILKIERKFTQIEQRFMSRVHEYTSFFSYNWLLRKLLGADGNTFWYIQFVKPIKCKKRAQTYEAMWNFFTSEDSAVTVGDVFQSFQKLPAEPQARVETHLPAPPFCANRWLKNYRNNLASEA